MIVDVRTPEEYAAGHAEGATNIPVGEIEAGSLGALASVSKDTPVQLYCRSGARSGLALRLLQTAGFSQVTNLGGLRDALQVLGEVR